MESNGIHRSLDHAKNLSSHALTGTLWLAAKPAFIDSGAIVGASYLVDHLLAPFTPYRPIGVLMTMALGSYLSTQRHKSNHLQHSALVTALVIVATAAVVVARGYDLLTTLGWIVCAFSALFFGYRRAFG